MRRRKTLTTAPPSNVERLRVRPTTSALVRPEETRPVLFRPSSSVGLRTLTDNSFQPPRGSGYVEHLNNWQAGRKEGTMLRPFRQNMYTFRKSELLVDPRAPGSNPARDLANSIRNTSRTSAERNTAWWLKDKGRSRLLSASVHSRLGNLAGMPLSELQAELDGPFREAMVRPRTSTGSCRSDWGAGPEPSSATAYSATRSHPFPPFSGDRTEGSKFWDAAEPAHDGTDLAIYDGRRKRWKLGTYAPAACQGDQAAIEGDEQDDTGYTDALYYSVTDVALDHKAQALHNQYTKGFSSKTGGNHALRLNISRQLFWRQHADRENEENLRRRQGSLIFVIHALFQSRKWICRAKKVSLETILEKPYRYMLISREQFEEFGRGERNLYQEEWERIQKGQKLVGEMPEIVSLLKAQQTARAIEQSRPTNLEDFPSADWLKSSHNIRERVIEHATARAEALRSLFPDPTMRISCEGSVIRLEPTSESWSEARDWGAAEIFLRAESSEVTPEVTYEFNMQKSEDEVSTRWDFEDRVEKEEHEVEEDDQDEQTSTNDDEVLRVDELEEDMSRDRFGDVVAQEKASQATSRAATCAPALVPETVEECSQEIGRTFSTGRTFSMSSAHNPLDDIDDEQLASILTMTPSHVKVKDVVCNAGTAGAYTRYVNYEASPESAVKHDEALEVRAAPPTAQLAGDAALSEAKPLLTCAQAEVQLLPSDAQQPADAQPAAQPLLPDLQIDAEQLQQPSGSLAEQIEQHDGAGTLMPPDPLVERWEAAMRREEERSSSSLGSNAGAAMRSTSSAGVHGVSISTGNQEGNAGKSEDGKVVLEMSGYDIRIRLTLEDMLKHNVHPASGRVRDLKWLKSTLSQISEDKLLSDAGDIGAGQPRQRMPVFTKKWLELKFGKNKFCEQQLADLICTMKAYESQAEVRLYTYAMCERFNAGQLSLLLHIRSFANSMASSTDHLVPLNVAQKVAAFCLDFAVPSRLAKVMDKIASKCHRDSKVDDFQGVGGRMRGIQVVDLLNTVLSGYGSAIHEFRTHLREEYDDLLHELARGLPRDGSKGRPLGSKVPFEIMSTFASKHFRRDSVVFESFFRSMLVNEQDISDFRSSTCVPPLVSETSLFIDFDDVIAIDDSVDLLGFDRRWDRLNQTDVCMVISEDTTPLWSQHNVNLSNLVGSMKQYKAELRRIAKRTSREAFRREHKAGESKILGMLPDLGNRLKMSESTMQMPEPTECKT